MTIDDEKSIYVGGLPYECTESQLRRVFDFYGSIVAVKIINDRGVGGRCYGFVTFKNPRSTIEAISEMDGRTIGGRVVRVNGVKARGASGRSNFGRESLRGNQKERDLDSDKGRGRERENDHDKDRQHENSLELDGERDRRHDDSRDHDHSRDHFQRRDQGQSRDLVNWERERDRGRAHSRNRDRVLERDKDLNASQDRELDRVADYDTRVDKNRDQRTKRKNSSSSCERHSRELSSEPSDYQYQMEEQLDMLITRREEVQKEKSDMEQRLEEKKRLIADLEKRSQKLEDLLASAKKQSSVHQMRLTKLHKCFQEVKECGERLKNSEEKLQGLVDSVSMEMNTGGDLGSTDAYLTNGKL